MKNFLKWLIFPIIFIIISIPNFVFSNKDEELINIIKNNHILNQKLERIIERNQNIENLYLWHVWKIKERLNELDDIYKISILNRQVQIELANIWRNWNLYSDWYIANIKNDIINKYLKKLNINLKEYNKIKIEINNDLKNATERYEKSKKDILIDLAILLDEAEKIYNEKNESELTDFDKNLINEIIEENLNNNSNKNIKEEVKEIEKDLKDNKIENEDKLVDNLIEKNIEKIKNNEISDTKWSAPNPESLKIKNDNRVIVLNSVEEKEIKVEKEKIADSEKERMREIIKNIFNKYNRNNIENLYKALNKREDIKKLAKENNKIKFIIEEFNIQYNDFIIKL